MFCGISEGYRILGLISMIFLAQTISVKSNRIPQDFSDPHRPSTIATKIADVSKTRRFPLHTGNFLFSSLEHRKLQRVALSFLEVFWHSTLPSFVYLYRVSLSSVGNYRFQLCSSLIHEAFATRFFEQVELYPITPILRLTAGPRRVPNRKRRELLK